VEKVPVIVKEPPTDKIVAPVIASGDIVRLAQVAPSVTVIVKCEVPELVSIITLSELVGTEAPERPPEVPDHLLVLFQEPAPPTQ
jgi:hypothetical protein